MNNANSSAGAPPAAPRRAAHTFSAAAQQEKHACAARAEQTDTPCAAPQTPTQDHLVPAEERRPACASANKQLCSARAERKFSTAKEADASSAQTWGGCAVQTAGNPSAAEPKNKKPARAAKKRVKTRKTAPKAVQNEPEGVTYAPEFCARMLAFFDVPPFKITEVMKKDGSVTLLETASELPTFAAFARSLGVTQARLMEWEEAYPDFAEAAKKARDLQGDILIQNSLRGNYSSSFAVFTAKNILGWSDGKDEAKKAERPLIVKWEK